MLPCQISAPLIIIYLFPLYERSPRLMYVFLFFLSTQVIIVGAGRRRRRRRNR